MKVYSIKMLLDEARSLKSEHGENLEYDRALCELIGALTVKPDESIPDAAVRVSKELGIYGAPAVEATQALGLLLRIEGGRQYGR